MSEHANEVIPYLLAIIGFFAVFTLNGIKGEIKEIKNAFNKLDEFLEGIDRRVTVLETRCQARHRGEE